MVRLKEEKRAILATAWFLALITAPMLGQLFSPPITQSMLERRDLATAPTFSDLSNSYAGFPGKLNAWIEDRFGFRRELIQVYVRLRDAFHLADSRFAVRGDDGWLFNALEGAMFMHEGTYPFAPGEAEAWLGAAAEIRQASCGAPFVILLAPNKHTIYPEFLSQFPRRGAGLSRLEALEEMAPAHDLRVVNPLAALLDAKPSEKVYFQTDTHWTFYGAYVGYRTLMRALQDEGLDVDILAPDRLTKGEPLPLVGDIYSLLGVENGAPETVHNWAIRDPAAVDSEEVMPALTWRTFEAKRIEMRDRSKPRLLMYGDSFAYPMMPFLKESFSEITFVHHRVGKPPLEALHSCEFDAVAVEFAERMLSFPLQPTTANTQ